MALQLGLVGLPNAGKSTLFNALTRAHAAVAPYPFTTIEPHVGVVAVPDPRLDALAKLIHPEKITPTTLEVVDIAGLVKDAHKGEGLGNQFLGHIRNVDAVALVARCFRNDDVPHVSGELDPRDDLAVLELELALADLATLEKRRSTVRTASKAGKKEFADELALLDHAHAHLAAGHPARTLELDDAQRALLKPLQLLTGKPLIFIANVGENDMPSGGELATRVVAVAQRAQAESMIVCAACEMDLAEWSGDDAAQYRKELGLAESGLERVIRAAYRLLDLITFFTATGGKEVRAWTLTRGATALDAAGQVHTDMARGFIRAEVIGCEALLATGSLATAREKGLLRLEGREYAVQDGDLIHFRFQI
ncbi:MAG: redox-regulated ATPase YchF [Chloroflexota bacterium]|nr:redox-regulated ATPase YchF [Chloroflexota bacterium]